MGEAQRNSPSLSKALRRAVRGGSHVACPGPGDMSQVAWLDCAGGSPVMVERGIAYVGNTCNPRGTLIIGVLDAPQRQTRGRTNASRDLWMKGKARESVN